MNTFWNDRYNEDSFVYGQEPNQFFKATLDKLPKGELLLPAEGEGRNAIYAAQKGWRVEAFDLSSVAMQKAVNYAQEVGVTINYQLSSYADISYKEEQFDAIALIYAHVPADKKVEFYRKLIPTLKKGGVIIFEGFSRKHTKNQAVNTQAGGPKNPEMLFTKAEMLQLFPNFETLLLNEESITLHEGEGHRGEAHIVRYIARKK